MIRPEAGHDGGSLAAELGSWAQARGVVDDPYVSELSTALAEGRELTYWATTSPMDMLPVPKSNRGAFFLRLSRDIAIVRNVIIFVPVALTWYAVGVATSSFETYIAQNATTTANFLEFWQNGYGIVPSAWRIGSVAQSDFYIIMLVIVLSLLVGSLNARGVVLNAIDEASFDRERVQLALAIQRHLHDRRDASAATLNLDLSSSTERLARAAQDIGVAAERLESSTAGVGALAPQLTAVRDQLHGLAESVMSGIEASAQGFTSTVSGTADDIRASLTSLVTAVEALQRLIDNELTASVNRSRAELDHLSDNLTATGSTVKRSARNIEDQLEELHRHLSVILRKDS